MKFSNWIGWSLLCPDLEKTKKELFVNGTYISAVSNTYVFIIEKCNEDNRLETDTECASDID